MAGANAVQIGTATFFDPKAPVRVLHELEQWCRRHRVARTSDLTDAVHRRPTP